MRTHDPSCEHFLGRKLYGDDFTPDEIAKWFREEEEGYATLGMGMRERAEYEYNALNTIHCFRHLGTRRYPEVLSVGGATGDELHPILSQVDRITILEPSSTYRKRILGEVPLRYVKPQPSGIMPFHDSAFDLITSFGCLHHIPNVSTVVREMARVLSLGGRMVFREPIVSMGDWRNPRVGLTKFERGIPLHIFRSIVSDTGMLIIRETLGGFPLTPRLRFLLNGHHFNSYAAVMFDKFASRCFAWNYRYHPTTIFHKFTPTFVSYVLEKPGTDAASAQTRAGEGQKRSQKVNGPNERMAQR